MLTAPNVRLETQELVKRLASKVDLLLPIIFAMLAVACLYRSPWSASDLTPVPDAEEYAIGAQRLATLGHFNLAVNSAVYPSRYAPWFSLMLAPLYMLAPHKLGIGILEVLAFAVMAVLCAYAIGQRLAGTWAAAACALGLLTFGTFLVWSRQIMTDVPAFACGLAACYLYLRIHDAPRRRGFLLSGVAIAFAFAFRPISALLIIPFVLLGVRRSDRVINLALLASPVMLVIIMTALYNHLTFGEWGRTGYQYWCSNIYDDPHQVLSLKYVRENLTAYDGWRIASKRTLMFFLLAALGAGLLWKRRDSAVKPFVTFMALAALPISVFHLFYFYPASRFHLLLASLTLFLICCGIVALLPPIPPGRSWILLPVLWVVLPTLAFPARTEPTRFIEAQEIAAATPKNAVIITSTDPVYLEPIVLRNTQRTILPLDRKIEYASKVVTPHKPSHPATADRSFNWRTDEPTQHIAPGSFLPCPVVADDHEVVQNLLRQGRRVYAEFQSTPKDDPAQRRLADAFLLTKVPHHLSIWCVSLKNTYTSTNHKRGS